MSRTLRDTQPMFTVRLPSCTLGARGMRPKVAFSPTSPVKPAGMRIDPPPSPAVARVTSPPATADALPPDEPPGVRPCTHGLCVAPFSTVRVTFTPPNSLAVVSPVRTAPADSSRCTITDVLVALRSANTAHASVSGQLSTRSSSFTPMGTPPKGREMSARDAASRARSGSRNEKALRSLDAMADNVASSSSTGERSPRRKASTSEQASPVHGVSDDCDGFEVDDMGGTLVRLVESSPMDSRQFLGLEPTHNPYRWILPVVPGISTAGGFLFGGCGLAAAVAAMEGTSGRRAVWATAQYLSYAKPGETMDIDVTVAVSGHQITQARAVCHVGDREILTVNAALGDRDLDETGQFETMPTGLPLPNECKERPHVLDWSDSISGRMDQRVV
ncbi:MAG: hypothetical protein RL550_1984, partial [Actinomycetota bacterium]